MSYRHPRTTPVATAVQIRRAEEPWPPRGVHRRRGGGYHRVGGGGESETPHSGVLRAGVGGGRGGRDPPPRVLYKIPLMAHLLPRRLELERSINYASEGRRRRLVTPREVARRRRQGAPFPVLHRGRRVRESAITPRGAGEAAPLVARAEAARLCSRSSSIPPLRPGLGFWRPRIPARPRKRQTHLWGLRPRPHGIPTSSCLCYLS